MQFIKFVHRFFCLHPGQSPACLSLAKHQTALQHSWWRLCWVEFVRTTTQVIFDVLGTTHHINFANACSVVGIWRSLFAPSNNGLSKGLARTDGVAQTHGYTSAGPSPVPWRTNNMHSCHRQQQQQQACAHITGCRRAYPRRRVASKRWKCKAPKTQLRIKLREWGKSKKSNNAKLRLLPCSF